MIAVATRNNLVGNQVIIISRINIDSSMNGQCQILVDIFLFFDLIIIFMLIE